MTASPHTKGLSFKTYGKTTSVQARGALTLFETCTVWSYGDLHMNGGWGLAPALTAPKPYHSSNLNINKTIYITTNNAWVIGNPHRVKALHHGGRSGVRSPRTPYNFKQPNQIKYGATWQPMSGPRGTIPLVKNAPRVEK
jgi:hypothetical protein